MAGPWFTVQESGEAWRHVDSIWISNGKGHEKVTVEVRVQLEDE